MARFDWGELARAVAPDRPQGEWTVMSIALRSLIGWVLFWLVMLLRGWSSGLAYIVLILLIALAPVAAFVGWIRLRAPGPVRRDKTDDFTS